MFGKQQSQTCPIATLKRGCWISGLFAVLAVTSLGAATLDDDINTLTTEITRHSARVHMLEQALLHPVNTRVAVFLSLADRQALELDSIELFIDGQPVASHLYTDTERTSLEQGGVQQVYSGNLADGSHRLKVVVNARAANKRFVRRERMHQLDKRPGTLRLQMNLDARAPDYEPDITFVEWK